MVEAFTKIACEFKKAQERYSTLKQILVKDRKTELYRNLKHKKKVIDLNTLVKSIVITKFISKIVHIIKNK
jgi:hypothetical protein